MTIRKGEQWGEPCSAPIGLPEFVSERDLGVHVRASGTVPEATLKSGTLIRALGVSMTASDRAQIKVMIDLIKVNYNGHDGCDRSDIAVGSVLIGRRSWLGDLCIVSNCGYLGTREVLSKAHPNDGLMDVLTVRSSMPFMQRLQAWRRISTSSHLPHPDISTKQTADFSWPLEGDEALTKGTRLVIDGEALGLVKSVRMQVIPDAITLYV
jgi:hypothetical protein